MSTLNKDSLKNCVAHNQDQLKQQYGFELLLYDMDEQINVESRDRHLFVFLIQGAISVSIDQNTPIHINQPNLFLLHELSTARIRFLSTCHIIVMCFKEYIPICAKEIFTDLTLFRPEVSPSIHKLKLKPQFLTFLKTIEDVLSLGASCTNYYKLKAKELFFLLNTYYTPSELSQFLEPLLSENFRLKSFVYKNYHIVNTVNELVERSGMSRTLFFEQFKNTFGLSVKQWMLRKKAELISEKLSEPNVILKEVMLDFGFSSASQFNRFCRVYLGDTPSNIVGSRK